MAEGQSTRKRTRPLGTQLLAERPSVAERQNECLPGLTVEARNRILKAIKDYDADDATDTNGPLVYTYSLLLRLEEQYAGLQSYYDETRTRLQVKIDALSAVLTSGVTALGNKLTKEEVRQISRDIERAEADLHGSKLLQIHANIATLSDQIKLTQKWMEDIVSQQKVIESKQKVEYISLLEHSAVLEAMLSVLSMSLLQAGLSEPTRLLVFKKFNELQSKYPVIDVDLERIRQRLFGVPDKVAVLDAPIADYEDVVETPPNPTQALQALNEATSGRK